MIEQSPVEYWIAQCKDDAVLYSFSLSVNGKTGWRLPTKEEFRVIYEPTNPEFLEGWYRVTVDNSYDAVAISPGEELKYSWGIDSSWFGDNMKFITMPVRDLKDD